MNIVLWILQVLLAAHTAMGAIWKFSNSEQAMPTLTMIPHGVWLTLSALELVWALGLVLPSFNKSTTILVPLSALCVAVEMLAFCGLHLSTGDENKGPLVYWTTVAAVCLLTAYGRYKMRPL